MTALMIRAAQTVTPVTIGPHPEERGAYELRVAQWLPRPLDEVFEFFSDAFNLEAITPPFLHFQVQNARPIAMFPGQTIDYRLKLHGFPMKWRSEIAVWEPPYRFVDQQLIGPYRKWHHLHKFSEHEGGTLVEDIVTYKVPGGALINRFFVQGDLQTIFNYRLKQLARFLGTPESAHS